VGAAYGGVLGGVAFIAISLARGIFGGVLIGIALLLVSVIGVLIGRKHDI
jgi:hypothetical protein